MTRQNPLLALAAAGALAAIGCSTDEAATPVTTCAGLCDLTPVATPEEAACVRTYMNELGHPIDTTPQCLGFISPQGCNICYGMLDPTDAECTEAWRRCY
jgi:hypothetical protein